MEKKKLLLLLLCAMLLSGTLPSWAQLTIDQCYDWAQSNYPLIAQYGLIEQSRDYTLNNASKGWLPQVNASVSGYAFTDVINQSNAMGQAIAMKNALASASVTVSQTIYDGGVIAAKKQLAQAQADVQRHSLDATIYEVRSRVNQLYFAVLLIDQRLRMNSLLLGDLRLSQKTVQSMVNNGVANQNDLDAVGVELLSCEQQAIGLRGQRQAYMQMLGALIGRELAPTDTLQLPNRDIEANGRRPELECFDSQERALQARRNLLDAQLRPHLSAMGMAMVHTKVSDMMKNGMLVGGITLSWNIGALYTRKNDLAQLELDRQQISVNRETFLFNNAQQSRLSNGQIESLQQQITKDDQIVQLRDNIRKRDEKRLMGGLASVNDLLRSINAVSEARQARALHEMQLLQETYNLNYINHSHRNNYE